VSPINVIHHEHARLGESLRRVREVARTITRQGVFDPDAFREVCRFIDETALPHLRHEEQVIFPAATARGVPPEVIGLLTRDHEQIRVLACLATTMGLKPTAEVLPHDAADVIEKLVRAFDEHARYEERIFADIREAEERAP
jgi:hemerythrin-like domain-containing protein